MKTDGPLINIQEVLTLVAYKSFSVNDLTTKEPPFNKFLVIYKRGPGSNQTIITEVQFKEGLFSIEAKIQSYAYYKGFRCRFYWFYDETKGSFLSHTQHSSSFLSHLISVDDSRSENEYKEILENEMFQEAILVSRALELMLCKNISYEDYDPNKHLSRQQRRQRERKGLPPLLTYKILHINPMSPRTIERRPKKPPVNQGVAVHAVRGHFKTFTDEHPAFGKPWGVGTFWCGPFVCGNPEFGLNWNDYHIEIEKEAPT